MKDEKIETFGCQKSFVITCSLLRLLQIHLCDSHTLRTKCTCTYYVDNNLPRTSIVTCFLISSRRDSSSSYSFPWLFVWRDKMNQVCSSSSFYTFNIPWLVLYWVRRVSFCHRRGLIGAYEAQVQLTQRLSFLKSRFFKY